MAAMKLGAGQNCLMVPGEVDNNNNDSNNKDHNKNSNNNK